jgi:hypothetical protein
MRFPLLLGARSRFGACESGSDGPRLLLRRAEQRPVRPGLRRGGSHGVQRRLSVQPVSLRLRKLCDVVCRLRIPRSLRRVEGGDEEVVRGFVRTDGKSFRVEGQRLLRHRMEKVVL